MKEFNEIYQEIYKENYVLLQNKRRDIGKRVVIILLITVLIGIIFSTNSQSGGALIILAINIGLVLSFFFTYKLRESYKKDFKEKVIGTFVKQYSNKLNYNYDRGVSALMYSRAEFEKFDDFHSEDYIHGNLKNGYKIFMSEVKTQEVVKVDQKGNTRKITIFRGLFAQVDFNKNIKDKIKLRTNTFKIFNNKKRVEMDSGQFEQIYDIYSDGKITTMQLFTSEIMDMFMKFKEKNKIVPELTLKNNTMYIRFKTGNTFESKLLTNPLDYNTLKKYYNILHFTLEITQKMLKNIEETEI